MFATSSATGSSMFRGVCHPERKQWLWTARDSPFVAHDILVHLHFEKLFSESRIASAESFRYLFSKNGLGVSSQCHYRPFRVDTVAETTCVMAISCPELASTRSPNLQTHPSVSPYVTVWALRLAIASLCLGNLYGNRWRQFLWAKEVLVLGLAWNPKPHTYSVQ